MSITKMNAQAAGFLHYYAREGLPQQVLRVCNELIKADGASPVLLFWRAYGLLASGAAAEATRELYALQQHHGVGPAATAALLAAHQSAKLVDHQAVAQLTARLEEAASSADGPAALHLAAFLFYSHAFERARALLEQQLRTPAGQQGDGLQQRAQALLGFVLLEQQAQEVAELQDASELRHALRLFEGVLAREPQDLEALLGKACALEALQEQRAAWQLLSEGAIRLPWAVPLHVELARLTLAQQDWDMQAEVAVRLQALDARNIMALAYQALHALLVAGDAKAAAQLLADMAAEVQRAEPSNAALMAQLAAVFARLAGTDAALLQITHGLADRALQLQPQNAHYAVEVAAQQLLLDQPAAAAAGFEAALRLDELHMQAALGLVEAHLALGQLAEAEQQLQFLPELLAATRSAAGPGPAATGLGEVQQLFHTAAAAADHQGAAVAPAAFGFVHVGGRLGLMAHAHARSRPASDAGCGSGGADAGAGGNAGGGGFRALQVVAGGGGAAEQAHSQQPLLLYLRGLLAWKQGQAAAGLQLLQQSLEQQLEAVEELPYGLGMLGALNASRMLGLVGQLLDSFGGDPRQASDPPSLLLGNCIRVLELLSRFLAFHPEVQLLSARASFLNGALDAAARKTAVILHGNAGSSEAALLVVSIHLRQGRPGDALVALEAAVSTDFSIREAPLYHLVHARVLLASGQQVEGARRVLESAMSLPGVRSSAAPEQAARLAKRGCLPSLHERASIFLLLAEAITRQGRQGGQQQGQDQAATTPAAAAAAARSVLQEAVRAFAGTREEARVFVAECEAAIAAGDVRGALARLQQVPPSSPHYGRACAAMADIHLRHGGDAGAYIRCYQGLVEKSPQDCAAHCLLAEAHMTIQEPDKAAAAYEAALALCPKDADLAVSAAKAHVAAHDYNRAIDCYHRAIRNDPGKLVLQHALAHLLLRLGRVGPATTLLDACAEARRAREEGGGSANLEALALDVDTWLLLAKLRLQSGDDDGFVAAQNQAIKLQCLLLDELQHPDNSAAAAAAAAAFARTSAPGSASSPGSAPGGAGGPSAAAATAAVSAKAASMCFDLAEFFRRTHAVDKADAAYTACLSHQPRHSAARLALARLALAAGRVDACQAHAAQLLEDQPDHGDAAIMLAEIMAHQGQREAAASYFQQLLDHAPTHYEALVQLLGMLRRTGKLDEAAKYIAAAEAAASAAGGRAAATSSSSGGTSTGGGCSPAAPAAAPGASVDGGLAFVKGLQQRYLGDPREALRHLNAARRDAQWAGQALLAMAEICLAPEQADVSWAADAGGGEDAGSSSSGAGDGGAAGTADAGHTASMLLQQLRPDDMQGDRYKVLCAYARMASKARHDVEAAVAQLLEMANADPNSVSVLMGLAHGFLLLKQTAKARNQLKRASKLPYAPDCADDFERVWLALADMHVAAGKHDLAQELCARCLKHNRSCGRARELLGGIAEREAAFGDAAGHYARAWELSGRADSALGYKLAHSHLRAGRHVDAAAVAGAVLAAEPGYPRLRADVLDKARAGLRA